MYNLIQLLPELILVAAVPVVLQLIVLAFRNPFRSRWLRRDWAAIAAALAIAALVSVMIGVAIAGGMAAGLGLGGAALLTAATGIGAGYAFRRAFDIGERLRRADQGQSPFYRPAAFAPLARGWRRPFGGGAGA